MPWSYTMTSSTQRPLVIPSLLRSNVDVWCLKITLGSGFLGSMISCFHSRRHSGPWYHDLKLTRYYSRYPNIISFTTIFLTKAVNYFGKSCTAALRSNCSTNWPPSVPYGSASRLDHTVLWRPCTVSVQTHGGLYCTEVVLLTTLGITSLISLIEWFLARENPMSTTPPYHTGLV